MGALASISLLYRKIVRAVQDPGRVRRALLRRLPGVISAGGRATCLRLGCGGGTYLKKVYADRPDALAALHNEMLARRMFQGEPWMSPILRRGTDYIILPLYPEGSRLDLAAKDVGPEQRKTIAKAAVDILFEMFTRGYVHSDFHARNLFYVDGQLIVTDFEHMQRHPEDRVCPFPESYDLTGTGLPSPGATRHMCYNADVPDKSLKHVLGIPAEVALDLFVNGLKTQMKESCSDFKSRGRHRHVCQAQLIYGSFDLPHMRVSREEAQRDSARRLSNMRIDGRMVNGRTVLDVGCNIGAILFEIQKFSPRQSVGLEYDETKVALAKRVATYNGLANMHFVQADIERGAPSEIRGPFDIVLCLSVEAYVRNKRNFYSFLAEMTRERLFFEGNGSTDKHEVVQYLARFGFRNVEFLGICDDDCLSQNNNRPMWMATK